MLPSVFNLSSPEVICQMEPGTCLWSYRGSVAHGMYVPKEDPNSIDDIDLMGFVIGEPQHYLGLKEWGSRGTKEYWVGHYDCVYYDIKKAVALLLQGNPNILGALWLHPAHYIHLDGAGRQLISIREAFLGKHIYKAFAGYASAQLQKMEVRDPQELRLYLAITAELKYRGAHPNYKGQRFDREISHCGEAADVAFWSLEKLRQGLARFQKKGENIGYMGDKRKQLVLEHGYDAKNAAHCIRLLRMALGVFRTGQVEVYRVSDAQELLDIKAGKWTLAEIKEHAKGLFADVKQAKEASALPDEADVALVEMLLLDILKERVVLCKN